MQVAFVVLLDPPSYNYVRKIQSKLYELFGARETLKLEPHFTIKYPFDVNDLNGAESYFDNLVSHTGEFEVDLKDIGTFENEKNVVFLGVEKSEALSKLHLKMLDDLAQKFSVKPAEFEGKEMRFHITLAYKDISTETFHEIKNYLKDEQPRFKFRIKRLGMYFSPDDISWFIYKIGNLA